MKTFAEQHPYQVVDARTGESLARFSNLGAAMASAKALARNRREGVDVVADGRRVAHQANPAAAQEAIESDTLP